MQFFATVLAAAAAAATPVAPPDFVYHVCNFRADCIPHSSQCRVAFNVWQYRSFETPPGVECEGFAPSRPDGTMTDLLGGHCKLSARTFNLTFCAGGATLRLTGPVSVATNLTGEAPLPSSDWKLENDNVATVLSYHGPTELDLVAVL